MYGAIDYVCDLANIPVEEKRYDLVLLTQVLVHIPEPMQVLNKIHRILKDGGVAVL
jgi:ubiquinone/menaquinone biosynthesis C-methylase UbiE